MWCSQGAFAYNQAHQAAVLSLSFSHSLLEATQFCIFASVCASCLYFLPEDWLYSVSCTVPKFGCLQLSLVTSHSRALKRLTGKHPKMNMKQGDPSFPSWPPKMGNWPEAVGHGNGMKAASPLKPSFPTVGTQSNFPSFIPSENLVSPPPTRATTHYHRELHGAGGEGTYLFGHVSSRTWPQR